MLIKKVKNWQINEFFHILFSKIVKHWQKKFNKKNFALSLLKKVVLDHEKIVKFKKKYYIFFLLEYTR